MNNFKENKEIIEETQSSDFDKEEALENLKNKYPTYHDDLYNDDDYEFKKFLNKYLPLCKNDDTKQDLFYEWATYWESKIVPHIKYAIDMGWKINDRPILFIACEMRDTDFITALLKNGADPNLSFNYENSLESVINGYNVEYRNHLNNWAYQSLYECLLILEKYGLKYNDDLIIYDNYIKEFIKKSPIPYLKKRLGKYAK